MSQKSSNCSVIYLKIVICKRYDQLKEETQLKLWMAFILVIVIQTIRISEIYTNITTQDDCIQPATVCKNIE